MWTDAISRKRHHMRFHLLIYTSQKQPSVSSEGFNLCFHWLITQCRQTLKGTNTTDHWIIDHYSIQTIWGLKVAALVMIEWSGRYFPISQFKSTSYISFLENTLQTVSAQLKKISLLISYCMYCNFSLNASWHVAYVGSSTNSFY